MWVLDTAREEEGMAYLGISEAVPFYPPVGAVQGGDHIGWICRLGRGLRWR